MLVPSPSTREYFTRNGYLALLKWFNVQPRHVNVLHAIDSDNVSVVEYMISGGLPVVADYVKYAISVISSDNVIEILWKACDHDEQNVIMNQMSFIHFYSLSLD